MLRISPIAALLLLGGTGACGGGTSLAPVDSRAERNQQRAAEAISTHAQAQCTSPGNIVSLSESIYCSAGGTLQRAGAPSEDAGIPCPSQGP
jgi:hypothetical protein